MMLRDSSLRAKCTARRARRTAELLQGLFRLCQLGSALAATVVFCLTAMPGFGQSYSPLYALSSSNNLSAYCTINGVITPNCSLSFYTGYYSGTNAHTHYSPTAPLSAITSSCVTNSSGYCPITITTTTVGHAEFAQACPAGGTCGLYQYAVGVTIYYVSTDGIWTFNGQTSGHGNSVSYNHWMTSNAAYGIYNATVLYQTYYPGLVTANDMSLPFGGVYDYLNLNWLPPHKAFLWNCGRHRRNHNTALRRRFSRVLPSIRVRLLCTGNEWKSSLPLGVLVCSRFNGVRIYRRIFMTQLRLNLLITLLAFSGTAHSQVVAGFSPIPTVAAGSTVPIDSPQFVFLGPTTSQLTISYPAALGGTSSAAGRITFTAKMLNQVRPTVSCNVSTNSDGAYQYAYTLVNDSAATNPIMIWSIAMPAVDAAVSATHPSWAFSRMAANTDPNPPTGTVSMSPVTLGNWHAPQAGSLAPGGTVAGFQIASHYLPGLTLIYSRSDDDYAVPSTLPAAVLSQLAPMQQRDWMNNRSVGIGPRFPTEWTNDVIAADFKDGVARLTESGVLNQASQFVTLLNSALDTLIGAPGASIPLDAVIAAAGTPMEKNIASAIAVSLR